MLFFHFIIQFLIVYLLYNVFFVRFFEKVGQFLRRNRNRRQPADGPSRANSLNRSAASDSDVETSFIANYHDSDDSDDEFFPIEKLSSVSLQELQIVACEACHFNNIKLMTSALDEIQRRGELQGLSAEESINFTTKAKSGRWRAAASPLVLAAGSNAVECGQELLKRGAELNVRTAKGVTAAIVAARKGKTEFLQFLLDAGADDTIGDISGIKPLHAASLNGRSESAELLLKHSPQLVDCRDDSGRTPLLYAAFNGHAAMVDLLLDHGADYTVSDYDHETVLHKIAHSGNIKLLNRFSLLSNQTALGPVAGPDSQKSNHLNLSPLQLGTTRGHSKWVIHALTESKSRNHLKPFMLECVSVLQQVENSQKPSILQVYSQITAEPDLKMVFFQSFIDLMNDICCNEKDFELMVRLLHVFTQLAEHRLAPATVENFLCQLTGLWSSLLSLKDIDRFPVSGCSQEEALRIVNLIRCYYLACCNWNQNMATNNNNNNNNNNNWNQSSSTTTTTTTASGQFDANAFCQFILDCSDSLVRPLLQQDQGVDLLLDKFDFILCQDRLRLRFTEFIRQLDFDCKLAWLHRRLKQESVQSRQQRSENIDFIISRATQLHQQSCTILKRSITDLKSGLNIKYENELAVGAGVTREWFQSVSRDLFNEDNALFERAPDGVSLQPNPMSMVNPDHLQYFEFAGRLVGMAIFHGQLIDCQLSSIFCKQIVGQPVTLSDLQGVDDRLHQSLRWLLDNDGADELDLTFTVDHEAFGQCQSHDLIANGHAVPVTDLNKRDYVQRLVAHKLTATVHPQLTAFLHGFHALIQPDVVAAFSAGEFQLLMSGLQTVNVDEWAAHTVYSNGYSAQSSQIQWFWKLVRQMSDQDKTLLIQFATGSARLPSGGFAKLRGTDGISKFSIARTPLFSDDEDKKPIADHLKTCLLPTASTCFNILRLPAYQSFDQLERSLIIAIRCGSKGFSFG